MPAVNGTKPRPSHGGAQNRHLRHNALMLKLYYAPNTCALASHIALEEVGAEYEAVRIDFASEEQRKPAYLAINPRPP